MREPVSAQTFTIYKLLRAMLEEHGLSLSDLLKINIYLKSMNDLPEMERIAQQFFRTAKPAAGIRGGDQRIWTVGVNWYPNPAIRLVLDYQHTDVSRLNAGGGDIGARLDAVSFRTQLSL